VDGSGNVLARYQNQMRVDEPLTEQRSGTASYYLQDGLGSPTSLSSGSGTLANTYTFDSYGKLTDSTGTLTNPFRYTAREFDQETGLYYYRARYYDGTVGRFISEDPIGFVGGINKYAYVLDNPIDRNDAFGLRTEIDFWNPLPYFGSEWGHVSVLINGTSYSWGPQPGSAISRECGCRPGKMTIDTTGSYVANNQQLRSGIGYVLSLTPNQEQQVIQLLNNYQKTPPNYNPITDNCLDPIEHALDSVGALPSRFFLFPDSFEDYLLSQPGLVVDWVTYPQNGGK
jgi:RHS repeat-associated protein